MGVLLITVVIASYTGLLRNPPAPTRRVAAIVITASLSIAHISGAMRLCRQRPSSAFHDYPFELVKR